MERAIGRNCSPVARVLALGAILLVPGARAAGDFAPLVVGNTWDYTCKEGGGGFSWNPKVSRTRHLALRVESRDDGVGGASRYVLSYRDSLYQRKTVAPLEQGTAAHPDTVLTGRFQVTETSGDGRLSVHSLGDPIPPWMEVFFRLRFRSGEVPVRTGSGDSLFAVAVTFPHVKNLRESAIYARDLGLIQLSRDFEVWGQTAYTPGYLGATCGLTAFNGRPVATDIPYVAYSNIPMVQGFAGLKPDRSWRYLCLRQVVHRDSIRLLRDSLYRQLKVIGVTYPAGSPVFEISWKDSVFQRTYDGQTRQGRVDTGRIRVDFTSGQPVVHTGSTGPDDPREDLLMHFNSNIIPEEALGMRDFGSGPVRVLEYREGFQGFLEDVMIHAEGIGLVRRTRFLTGKLFERDLPERLDWRLVEIDGQPFDAAPVSIRRLDPARDPLTRSSRTRSAPHVWRKAWDLRDLLGRMLEP